MLLSGKFRLRKVQNIKLLKAMTIEARGNQWHVDAR
jgi:hypothetical protein